LPCCALAGIAHGFCAYRRIGDRSQADKEDPDLEVVDQVPILPPVNGYLFLDKAKFRASFAGDLDAAKAGFMADSQVPWGVNALDGTVTKAAWKTRPSWYMVTKDDRMIPPDAQRFMAKRAGATVVEEHGSHAIYVSRPEIVAGFIAKVASGVTVGSA